MSDKPTNAGPGRRFAVAGLAAVVVLGVGGFLLLDGDAEDPAAGPGRHTDTAYETPTGEAVPLSTFVGRPIVLNFFASWCVPCAAELPDFEKVSRTYGDRVEFLSVAENDRPAEAAELIADTGVTYRWGLDPDGALFEEFGAAVMPTTVLLRADGAVAEVHAGILSEDELRDLVEAELL